MYRNAASKQGLIVTSTEYMATVFSLYIPYIIIKTVAWVTKVRLAYKHPLNWTLNVQN